jgi:hypothetical protein
VRFIMVFQPNHCIHGLCLSCMLHTPPVLSTLICLP